MVTTTSPSPSPSPAEKEVTAVNAEGGAAMAPEEKPGFVDLLIQSIWEPGANAALVMSMNVSFFLLVITLFGLAVITHWNVHVLSLLGISTLLWGAMVWFIMQLTAVQTNPENMPITDMTVPAEGEGAEVEIQPPAETRKDQ